MSEVKNKWDELWTYVTEDVYSGHGKSIEEAKQVHKAFEVENSLIFVQENEKLDLVITILVILVLLYLILRLWYVLPQWKVEVYTAMLVSYRS